MSLLAVYGQYIFRGKLQENFATLTEEYPILTGL